MTDHHRQTLSDWHRQLKTLQLPVDGAVKAAALKKLNTDNANAANVAAIVRRDPALCLLLMRKANERLNRSNNETTSLAHTISLLGFPFVVSLIGDSQECDKKSFAKLSSYRHQIGVSVHAGYQVQTWAEQNPHWPTGELFWAAVFQHSVYWALWYVAGEQLMQLQQLRQRCRGAQHNALEQAVFGCKLSELSRLVSHSWHLPRASQLSWQPAQSGTGKQWVQLSQIDSTQVTRAMEQQPALQRISTAPAFAITLANRMAENADWYWYSKQTLRLQKLLAVAMHSSLDQAIALSHTQALVASRHYHQSISPGVQLLGLFNRIGPSPGRTSAAQVQTGRQGSSRMAIAPRALTNAIARLQQQPEIFADQRQLFEFALQSLGQEAGFERVTISLLNRPAKRLRSRFSFGCEQFPALRDFSHALQRGDLFHKLLQKPLSVQLTKANKNKIESLLPQAFIDASAAETFLMMSIFSQQQPVAMVYADPGPQGSVDPQQYYLFKQLCGALSQSLGQRANS